MYRSRTTKCNHSLNCELNDENAAHFCHSAPMETHTSALGSGQRPGGPKAISYQSVDEGELMLDHVFVTVKISIGSIAFYETALKSLALSMPRLRRQGWPRGAPDLKGFGRDGRVFFWSGRAMRLPGCAYWLCRQGEQK